MTDMVKRGTVGGFAMALVVGGSALVGCASGSKGDLDVGEEVTATVSSRLSDSSIKAINGTYTGCVAKSGSWSVRVSGSDPLTNPALSVVMNDTGCVLAITEIVADQVYTGTPALPLNSTYNAAASTFANGGTSFKANAKLSSAAFSADFSISLVHEDDPSTQDGGALVGTYATVTTTTINTLVPASDYTFSLTTGTALGIAMDANKSVVSVSGGATLVAGSSAGSSYVVDRGTLSTGITLADIATAWATESTAGRVTTLPSSGNATIPASAFALTGLSLNSNVVRTVIVARTVGAVTAYQVFRVTFKGS